MVYSATRVFVPKRGIPKAGNRPESIREMEEAMLGLLLLNSLNSTDVIFFVVIAAIVVLCIAVYFLIPVINRKQFREQRENLKKREVAFKSNIQRSGMQAGEPSEGDTPAGQAEPKDASVDPVKNEER